VSGEAADWKMLVDDPSGRKRLSAPALGNKCFDSFVNYHRFSLVAKRNWFRPYNDKDLLFHLDFRTIVIGISNFAETKDKDLHNQLDRIS
jgi:hypothetical protein